MCESCVVEVLKKMTRGRCELKGEGQGEAFMMMSGQTSTVSQLPSEHDEDSPGDRGEERAVMNSMLTRCNFGQ